MCNVFKINYSYIIAIYNRDLKLLSIERGLEVGKGGEREGGILWAARQLSTTSIPASLLTAQIIAALISDRHFADRLTAAPHTYVQKLEAEMDVDNLSACGEP